MSAKLVIFVLFSATLALAEEEKLCPCDTEQDAKDNKDLWSFLTKLSGDVSEDLKDLYAVPPNNLLQADCSHCDEKQRTKRKVFEPEAPVEVPEGEDGSEDREKRTVHPVVSKKCPKGYIRLLHYCLPQSKFEASVWEK